VLRYEFYRWTLRRCGENVVIGFGTVFLYRDVAIGDNVLIGMYNTIHHCDFGSYVVVAEGCRFLSGSRYHNFERTDIPMAVQGGRLRRIRVGNDCWVGANAIVMSDIGSGSVVGAGAVVTAPVQALTIVAGNPARVIRRRQ
jgi:acetyltransferase-like isoleucine patch superfamily enzyme